MTTAQDSPLAPPGVSARLSHDLDARVRDRLMVLVGLAAGGATLVTRARPLAPTLPLGLLLALLVTVTLRQRRHAAS